MTVEIKVPALGESVSEATVARWYKAVGDAVAADEPLVELETDKVTVEVPAATAGTLSEIVAAEGTNVEVGALLGAITEGAGPAASKPAPAAKAAPTPAPAKASAVPPAQAAAPAAGQAPSVRRIAAETGIDPATVAGTGKGGRVTKGDMIAHVEGGASKASARGPREERVRMSRLRQRIAQRLKEAQNTAAMLTTFNEVDMSALLKLRSDYRDTFEKKHGVRLGFMSFFAKASVVALREIPSVNGEIDGDEIVFKNYYDIGVAVSAPQGLVVPVLRDVDEMSFAGVEKSIADYGRQARDGKLAIEDLTGGTFTISNGGVFGSLLSTPILNPPQSAILGMHKIEKRPVVVDDAVVVRPMMYLALSYDHRIVDGREAVMFLVRVKECIEDPQRILLDM
ncbi:MAG: 2-oxoglutarate dehydrogenase complex dihydrolipoyllysine-residue succinyltransferase [Alphaproteobacteria bacterium]